MTVHGESSDVASSPAGYAEMDREWKDGDGVHVALPMTLTTETLGEASGDGPRYVAFKTGRSFCPALVGGGLLGLRLIRSEQAP